MGTATAGRGQQPYASPHHPTLHSGIVAVTGNLTVDLGVRHNNFVPSLSIKGGLADLAPAHILAWDYGTEPGTFVIQVGKATSAIDTTVIAATTAVDVSFFANVGAAVEA